MPHQSAARPAAAAIAVALLESERRLAQLTETSLQAKLVHRCFRPLFANTAFLRLFGYNAMEQLIAESSVACRFDAQTNADPLTAWERAASGGPQRTRMLLHRRDGEVFLGDVYTRPILWDDEPAVAVAIMDVTAEDVARRNLAHAKAEAEAASRAKRRFLSAASHGLRTPLHAAMGRLQLLQGAALPTREAEMADEAMRACQRLLHHVDDVLDCAASESGDLVAVREPFSPQEALESAIRIARDAMEGVTIELKLSGPPAARLVGDERRTQRIALALLEEAIARGPLGTIALQACMDAEGLSLVLTAQCAAEIGAEPAGAAGAIEGMAMARLLVSGLGGVLVERSPAAQIFNVTAFLPFPPAPSEVPKIDPKTKGARILVVEDNAGNRRLLHVILTSLGQIPLCVDGGAEGVAAAARYTFDLVLMDLSMPGVDGFEAARRIRMLPSPYGEVPIVALTASTGPDMRERAQEAGMDGFLQKPVEIPKLASAIALFARPRAAEASVDPPKIEQVQREHDEDESDDGGERGHAQTPVRQKVSNQRDGL